MRSLASSLKQIIRIEDKDSDLIGNDEVWKEIAILRAHVQTLGARSSLESIIFMQQLDVSLTKFRIRYINFLKHHMRIRYKDSIYKIKKIINEEELNISMLIIAQELL